MHGRLSTFFQETYSSFFKRLGLSSFINKHALLGFTLGRPLSIRSFSKRVPTMELPIGYDNFPDFDTFPSLISR